VIGPEQLLPDPQGACLEVDVAPAQSKYLAAPKSVARTSCRGEVSEDEASTWVC